MAYRLPTFNIEVNFWRHGHDPATDDPDGEAWANFCHGHRSFQGDTWTAVNQHAWYPTSFLLMPVGTVCVSDIDDPDKGDTVEIPADSGRYYHILWQDISAMGFANEHVTAVVVKRSALNAGSSGGGGGGGGGGGDAILMEDGTDILWEDGSVLEMES